MSSIKLSHVSLDYVIKTGSDSLKGTAVHILRNLFNKSVGGRNLLGNSLYRALNNIDLEIREGDRVGLMGRNGAGKSTLLRVMARVYRPDFGLVEICGKISSLFDVNLGMNREATGYENIVNLAMMRGHSKAGALSRVGDIETFTELGEFLKNPVRTYSAGMQMKLAFAVATSIPPEILLIDEVIGVGDMHFMKKAIKRLEDIVKQSHILVLTSHSVDVVRRFCNKVVVLEGGEIRFMGDVEEGLKYHQTSLQPRL